MLEGEAAAREPGPNLVLGEGVQVDDGAAPVVGVLAPVDEVVGLELGRELARGGEREAELARELADGSLALGADVGEHRHVPAAERRLPVHELEQLRRGSPPGPEPAHDPPQEGPELVQLGSVWPAGNSVASMIVIIQ